ALLRLCEQGRNYPLRERPDSTSGSRAPAGFSPLSLALCPMRPSRGFARPLTRPAALLAALIFALGLLAHGPAGEALAERSAEPFAARPAAADALAVQAPEAPVPPRAPAGPALRVAPSLTGTIADALDRDADLDGLPAPGGTVGYTAVVATPGSVEALNGAFALPGHANTTLVPGAVDATPLARADAYAALGNVPITVPAGSGVLANDDDPD